MFEVGDDRKECPSCALPVDANADVCPHCGYDLPRQKSSLQIAALVFALLLLWPIIQLIRSLLG
ncbi:MAG: zinc ribbon domain-containing protein [Rhodothermales bacterium]